MDMSFLDRYCNKPAGNGPRKLNTPEKYASNAKQFLSEADIRSDLCRKTTFSILSKLDPETIIPKKNHQIRIRTQKQLNMISILCGLIGKKIADEVTITTYTLNKEALNILCDLLVRKKIKKLSILLSSSYSFRDPTHKSLIINTVKKLSAKYKIHLTFIWSHFKITLLKIGNDYYQIEGSMNYSQNNMAENLFIENNKKSYEHDHEFIQKIINADSGNALEKIC